MVSFRLLTFVSSVALHEFVHFVQDGFRGSTICFIGWSSPNMVGWYYSTTNGSETVAYIIQCIYLSIMVIFEFLLFKKVYLEV